MSGLAASDDLQCLVGFGLDDGDVYGVGGNAGGQRGEGGSEQGFAGARERDYGWSEVRDPRLQVSVIDAVESY